MGKISESKTIQGKEYNLGGVDLIIYPANIDLLEHMMALESGEKTICPHCRKEIATLSKKLTNEEREEAKKKNAVAMKEIVYATMRESDPDSSEQEVKRFCFINIEKIMDAIKEVNELEDGDASK